MLKFDSAFEDHDPELVDELNKLNTQALEVVADFLERTGLGLAELAGGLSVLADRNGQPALSDHLISFYNDLVLGDPIPSKVRQTLQALLEHQAA